jgi:hypothetical protein
MNHSSAAGPPWAATMVLPVQGQCQRPAESDKTQLIQSLDAYIRGSLKPFQCLQAPHLLEFSTGTSPKNQKKFFRFWQMEASFDESNSYSSALGGMGMAADGV